jgi:hypothetical protein
MNIRNYKSSDYSVISEWWKSHKWPVLPEHMLPKTGMIIDNFCAGFLYKTDSSIAWLEFIISNPSTKKEERADALDILIKGLVNRAKEDGFKTIFTSVEHPSLITKYKNNGFVIGDTNMTNLVRLI